MYQNCSSVNCVTLIARGVNILDCMIVGQGIQQKAIHHLKWLQIVSLMHRWLQTMDGHHPTGEIIPPPVIRTLNRPPVAPQKSPQWQKYKLKLHGTFEPP